MASSLVSSALAEVGTGMLGRELATRTPAEVGIVSCRRRDDRRRGPLALLSAVTSGLSLAREPRTARERFEQELQTLARARSASLHENGAGSRASVCVEVPTIAAESRS